MQYEEMKYEEPNERAKDAVRQLRSAQKALQEALQGVAEINPKLKRIELRGSAARSVAGPIELGCVIIVVGDDQDEADRHCKEMQDQGCSCQSTGPATCECDCSGV
jgi:hypothetical protein